MKQYHVNEVFHAPQGEGNRAGEMSTFVRFTGCNLRCRLEPGDKSPGGFDCDTEFESGIGRSLQNILLAIQVAAGTTPGWLVLTGGEPGLQVDAEFIDYFHKHKYKLAIETNGTVELPKGLDWVYVSPKVAEHALRQLEADEVKYVRAWGQGIPKPRCQATFKYLSPAFANRRIDQLALEWCLHLIEENPEWRLSTQQHHGWGVR